MAKAWPPLVVAKSPLLVPHQAIEESMQAKCLHDHVQEVTNVWMAVWTRLMLLLPLEESLSKE
jgi:hypothetical protein